MPTDIDLRAEVLRVLYDNRLNRQRLPVCYCQEDHAQERELADEKQEFDVKRPRNLIRHSMSNRYTPNNAVVFSPRRRAREPASEQCRNSARRK